MDNQGRIWKWAIEPHPYSSSHYDFFLTDDDQKALEAILAAAEYHLWDTNEEGTRTLTVNHSPKYTEKTDEEREEFNNQD
jgi:hypothetical protein